MDVSQSYTSVHVGLNFNCVVFKSEFTDRKGVGTSLTPCCTDKGEPESGEINNRPREQGWLFPNVEPSDEGRTLDLGLEETM